MNEITEIKIMMTIALILYGTGIVLGMNQRKWRIPRWTHLSVAFSGFYLDMWATWKMEQLRHEGWESYANNLFLLGHTIVSTLAIIFFLTIVFFGVRKRIKFHRVTIFYFFVPSWLISYSSGILLMMVSPDPNLASVSLK